jgi:tRNA(fMet)-specific endonuclease VapC
MLERLTVLDFEDSSARAFGRITAYLYAHGSPRGDTDLLITSVVLMHGERLVTRNTRHFAGIPELVVDTY